jgi:hypothetical protein
MVRITVRRYTCRDVYLEEFAQLREAPAGLLDIRARVIDDKGKCGVCRALDEVRREIAVEARAEQEGEGRDV